jgi:Avidin family
VAIDGDWYNELRSHMSLKCNDGKISGYYETAVGSASGRYDLTGSYDTTVVADVTFAFTVTWTNGQTNTPSTTAWCGQYQSSSGVESLITTWLLTSSTQPGDDWESTLVGEDTFTRTQPSAATQALRLLRAASHPGVKRPK